MNKYLSLFLLLGMISCKKTYIVKDNNIVIHDTIYVKKTDTTLVLKHDTVIKSWRDTILKVVHDTLYKTKHDTTFITSRDTVVIIKYTAPLSLKLQILFSGTSITYGSSSVDAVVPYEQTYPYDVRFFFSSSNYYGGWGNFAVPGASVQDIISNQVPAIINARDPINYGQTIVCIEAGINDIRVLTNPQDIYAQIKSLHKTLHKIGIKTIVITPTACNSDIYTLNNNSAIANNNRLQLADLLTKGWKTDIGALALVDLTNDPYVGKYTGPTSFNTSIFQADGIHLTPLGYSIIARNVEKAIFSLSSP